MRGLSVTITASLTLLSGSALAVVGNPADLSNQYIVVLHSDVSQDKINQISQAVRQANGKIGHRYTTAIKGFSVTLPAQALKSLQQRFSDIDYVEPDMAVFAMPRNNKPDKPGGGNQSGSEPPQVVPWGIDHVGGPMAFSSNTAWIIDTGIDLNNADLNVDAKRSANFARGKYTLQDGNGHGTHVAGTIAAIDNSIGVVGVAPGTAVVPVRVLDNTGSGSISGVIAGVDWVLENGESGDCANLSLGAKGYSQSLEQSIKAAAAKGINFSIAAGNSTDDASLYTPASVQGDNIYTVSAIDINNTFAWFSNFGAKQAHDGYAQGEPVDYAAPGVNIESTKVGGGTVTYNGTSMAAPHVCGLLLATGGQLNSAGIASQDPDGVADPVAHR